ncbi:hypothetical protein PHMEG_0009872 [Phytophthora megakarya]|uniref:Uncharacterized protein n=1 Tax=Phytophthora megakarya TaxID=4795 RepID=A0A225WFQ2_9STRA|nr:hypothetical protein PHMEG_0009872 [Phytophthora megakarya]
MLRRLVRSNDPLRPCDNSRNGVTGHKINMKVVNRHHVDAILGTDTLKVFRAVVDLDESTLPLKTTSEVFQLVSLRVEESHSSKINSTARLQPGGQVIVIDCDH